LVIYSMASLETAKLPAVARTILTGVLNAQTSVLKDLRASSRAANRVAGR
jgi:hypothetical protein